MIDRRQCSYVLTIAECRSFSRAAEQLYIAQPSLSRYIKNLEAELGICLFDRDKIPLELTPAGETFILYIRKFQALEIEMKQELSAFGHSSSNELHIGSLTFLASYILPVVIPVFVESFPQAEVNIREYRSNQLKNSLLSHDVDLFITNLPPSHPELDFCTIAKDRVLLITRRTHSLEQKYDLSDNSSRHPFEISLENLKNSTFVLLRPWQNMHTIAKNIFAEENFFPEKVIEAPSITSAISLTSRKEHFTFVCESALRYIVPDMPLAYFSVGTGSPMASITIAFCKKNENRLIPEFCRFARQIFCGTDN